MEDAFKELEDQLASLSYGVTPRNSFKQTTTGRPSSSTVSTPTPSSNPPLSPTSSSTAALEKELAQWKTKAQQSEQKVAQLEQKLNKFAEAVKEEREIHEKDLEDVRIRAEQAEERADSLEEKMTRLIELVKQDRAKMMAKMGEGQGGGSGISPQVLKQANDRAEAAEQRAQQLSLLVGELEATLQERETLLESEKEAHHAVIKEKDALALRVTNLENQLQLLQQQKQKGDAKITELTEEMARNVKSFEERLIAKTSNPENSVKLLEAEENARKSQARADELQEKLSTLVAAVKKDRQVLQDKINSLEKKSLEAEKKETEQQQKIYLLEKELREAQFAQKTLVNSEREEALQQRILQLESELEAAREKSTRAEEELQLRNSGTVLVESPPPLPAEEEDLSGGGPPPPPPPPPLVAINFIDSSKLNIKSANGVPKSPSTPSRSAAGGNPDFVEEIKKGVKLRKVENLPEKTTPVKASPAPNKAGMGGDMFNLGQMASELAKQRQQRVQLKKQMTPVNARKSATLSSLLKELDTLGEQK